MRSTLIITALLACSLPACVTALSAPQKAEYAELEARGLQEEEKDVTTAMLLGILPGGGSFYTGNPGTGVASVLLWPLSVLWDPVNGANGAELTNYYATKAKLQRLAQGELDDLAAELETGRIDERRYLIEKAQIEKKYKASL